MPEYWSNGQSTLYQGDVIEVLNSLPEQSVHTCVTSPPYWGLRDYGSCGCGNGRYNEGQGGGTGGDLNYRSNRADPECTKCNGTGRLPHADYQLGLEPTPVAYVENMVKVFRAVRRVLRDDGTLWLNLGDSYAAGGNGVGSGKQLTNVGSWMPPKRAPHGLKPKDLVGIPWRVALALQQPYYVGRIKAERDRVWMAAMIDGEGTICGFRHERKDNGAIRTGSLVFITNSDTAILDECERIWPGARYIETLKTGDEVLGATATRDCWRWQIQKAEERSLFLREIYPYLVGKKQQGLVGWNLTNLSVQAKSMGRGGESQQTKAKRDVLAAVLSDLNQRRPTVIPSWVHEPPGVTEPGWYLRSDVIWSKNNPMPESVTDRPTKSHEYLFLLTKNARYYYDHEAIMERAQDESMARYSRNSAYNEGRGDVTPYAFKQGPRGSTKGGKNETSGLRSDEGFNERWKGRFQPDNMDGHSGYTKADGSNTYTGWRNKRTVWTVATQPYSDAHFATYPEKLIEPCILAGSPEGGTVLDPFIGSGTTCVVAERLWRKGIGIDLNSEYLNLAIKRIQNKSLPMFTNGLGV